ncbi:transcriptional regulator, ArsR family [Haladaptatus litoreus]|uniref:Transcriptional regulator, ArsR family n=1 Tax=Haladaptatus litoreus TaxID=553468 RepID=A0A1N7CMM3_9EURY|nr:metalloregulator ArsR/SmtB family transcription factor [Haladaptatus litoreus]SIR64852.1 transcriptional regulator, ArsR family [Haladaptatus litoreus]
MKNEPPTEPATDPQQSVECGCCSTGQLLSEDDIRKDVTLLSATANYTRYEALRRIAASTNGVCVCELAPTLGVSQSAVSHALSRLHTDGLVTRRKDGRWRYYEATAQAETLLSALDTIRQMDHE